MNEARLEIYIRDQTFFQYKYFWTTKCLVHLHKPLFFGIFWGMFLGKAYDSKFQYDHIKLEGYFQKLKVHW